MTALQNMHRFDFILLFHITEFSENFVITSRMFLLPVQISSHRT